MTPHTASELDDVSSVRNGRPRVGPDGCLPVPWDFLRHLDSLPCDVWLRNGRRAVLYARPGALPAILAERAAAGVEFVVRAPDLVLMRAGLIKALRRTLEDERISLVDRSRRSYAITTSIVAPILMGASTDLDDFAAASGAVAAITNVIAKDDKLVWEMVASMQADFSIHTHAMNTSVLAAAFAMHLGVADLDVLRTVGTGAMLADLGLSRVGNGSILVQDPSSLTPIEQQRLAIHPLAGYALLRRRYGSEAALPPFARVVAEHEERLDGSGPRGLRADQIALESQIAGLADTYDRLTLRRPDDHPGLSPVDALRQIRYGTPGAFRERLVAAFVAMFAAHRLFSGAVSSVYLAPLT